MEGVFTLQNALPCEKDEKIIVLTKFFDQFLLHRKAVSSCKYRSYVPYKILIKNLLKFYKNFLDENIANLV